MAFSGRSSLKRKTPHKEDCQCGCCRNKQGDPSPHKSYCPCAICRNKRGEIHGRNSPFYGQHHSIKSRKKNSTSHKQLWRNSKFVEKQRQIRGVSPNKSEALLLSVLNRLAPGQWKFVGDFQLNVNGKFPDFVHISKPLLIELFGEHWHTPDEVEPRIQLFKKSGYQTLILWDYELPHVEEKVISFQKKHNEFLITSQQATNY